jgi:ArsR family transcriptional regulator
VHILLEEVPPTQALVEFLKMLDDPTRLKILRLLLEHELCVCQLVELLKLPQPTVSQHLAKLRMMRLVSERKSAQWVYYSANREAVTKGVAELEAFLLGTQEQAPQLSDQWRVLADLPDCEALRAERTDQRALEAK